MNMIKLKNEKYVNLVSSQDIIDVAIDIAGHEYGNIIRGLVIQRDASRYAKKSLITDLQNYEDEIVLLGGIVEDITTIMEDAKKYVSKSAKISRKEVDAYLKKIEQALNCD